MEFSPEAFTSMIGEAWDPKEAEDYFNSLEEHPLFAETVPEPGTNSNFDALNTLMEEDETPYSMALRMKENGNLYFKKGKSGWSNAAGFYNKGIDYLTGKINLMAPIVSEVKDDDEIKCDELHSILLSNRSAVHLAAKNYGATIRDCKKAIAMNPSKKMIKAYFRAASALNSLRQYTQAMHFIESGLKFEPTQVALLNLKATVEESILIKQRISNEAQAKEMAQRQKNKRLYSIMKSQGINIGPPLFDGMKRYPAKPMISGNDNNSLIWPVLFLYEEHMQCDFVEHFPEDEILSNQLSLMFPMENGGECAPWDKNGDFRLDNIEVYFHENYTDAFEWSKLEGGANLDSVGTSATLNHLQKKWVQVSPYCSLKQILTQKNYVVPSFPVLHIVARNTKFYDAFMRKINMEQDGFPEVLQSNLKEFCLYSCGYKECNKLELNPDQFKKCAGCNVTPYCRRECQRADWKRSHKKLCKTFRAKSE